MTAYFRALTNMDAFLVENVDSELELDLSSDVDIDVLKSTLFRVYFLKKFFVENGSMLEDSFLSNLFSQLCNMISHNIKVKDGDVDLIYDQIIGSSLSNRVFNSDEVGLVSHQIGSSVSSLFPDYFVDIFHKCIELEDVEFLKIPINQYNSLYATLIRVFFNKMIQDNSSEELSDFCLGFIDKLVFLYSVPRNMSKYDRTNMALFLTGEKSSLIDKNLDYQSFAHKIDGFCSWLDSQGVDECKVYLLWEFLRQLLPLNNAVYLYIKVLDSFENIHDNLVFCQLDHISRSQELKHWADLNSIRESLDGVSSLKSRLGRSKRKRNVRKNKKKS